MAHPNHTRIITSGRTYLDIDAYAGCIAYAELLQNQGVKAQAVSTAIINESVPEVVRQWKAPLVTVYKPLSSDTYTLIDVSEPAFFESFVDLERVDEIIDHHPGRESFWHERIGNRALIEHIGAACTQVFEKWEKAGRIKDMSETSARLLMCGILDNTLNFGAEITSSRDRHAYKELSKIANLPEDWPAHYFSACQKSIMLDLAHAIENDYKVLDFKTFPRTLTLGQCAVWDPNTTAHDAFQVFKDTLASVKPDWAMNIIGIGDKRSHFVSDAAEVKQWLEGLLGVRFDGNVAIADRTWLRKEIMKADIDKNTL